MDILKLVGDREPLFLDDIERLEAQLKEIISGSSFLVIGGAGSSDSGYKKYLRNLSCYMWSTSPRITW